MKGVVALRNNVVGTLDLLRRLKTDSLVVKNMLPKQGKGRLGNGNVFLNGREPGPIFQKYKTLKLYPLCHLTWTLEER